MLCPTSLVSVAALLALVQSMDTPVPEGGTCLIGGFGPKLCKTALTCVISRFVIVPDRPHVGTCTMLNGPPEDCKTEICAKFGASKVCKTRFDGPVTTCGVAAMRSGGLAPPCPATCPFQCRTPRLFASNGEKFCNLCFLHSASCKSGYTIYGPVNAQCTRPIPAIEVPLCCIEQNIGCIARGKTCFTRGNRTRAILICKTGLQCVLDKLKFPFSDRPNAGKCRAVISRRVKKCSIKRCSMKGPKLICQLPNPGTRDILLTCRAWARRSDGTPGPKCNLPCPEFCVVTRKPVASNGQEFCSVCKLREASCRSDFIIFGPVRRT